MSASVVNSAFVDREVGARVAANSRLRDAANEIVSMFGAPNREKAPELVALEAFFDAKKRADQPPMQPPPIISSSPLLTHLPPPPLIPIAPHLKRVRSIRPARVDLSELNCGDNAITELCLQLLGHRELIELHLVNVGLGATGASSVAELIAISLNLKRIDLSRNKFGDEGAVRLARGLRSSRSLHRLDLTACGVGDAGALALAASLSERRIAPLRHLGLALHPELGTVGVEALLEAASICPQLNSMELAGASAPPPLLSAVQLALTPEGKRTPSVSELWESGVHSAFTLRGAPLNERDREKESSRVGEISDNR